MENTGELTGVRAEANSKKSLQGQKKSWGQTHGVPLWEPGTGALNAAPHRLRPSPEREEPGSWRR